MLFIIAIVIRDEDSSVFLFLSAISTCPLKGTTKWKKHDSSIAAKCFIWLWRILFYHLIVCCIWNTSLFIQLATAISDFPAYLVTQPMHFVKDKTKLDLSPQLPLYQSLNQASLQK